MLRVVAFSRAAEKKERLGWCILLNVMNLGVLLATGEMAKGFISPLREVLYDQPDQP